MRSYFVRTSKPQYPIFQLTGPNEHLRADGLFETINTPATGGNSFDGLFQTRLRQAFEHARRQGQNNPIVVGAIPFDTDEPSKLFIPSQYRFSPRPSFTFPPAVDNELGDIHCEGQEAVFKEAVNTALRAVNSGTLRKVVLSRVLDIHHCRAPDPQSLYGRLVIDNPTAYNFCHTFSESEAWVGASPELLLSKRNGTIRSQPLAGSAPRGDTAAEDMQIAERLRASVKDQREHAWVVDDIAQRLRSITKSLTVPQQPSLCSTETMWHLATSIEGEVDLTKNNALQLACLLHPTPAVCGFPTDAARELISATEKHARGLYSGMLGWCDSHGNGEWVLTLRCAHLKGKTSRLFAGAGIIDGSNSDAEWAETSSKLKTMINAFEAVREI